MRFGTIAHGEALEGGVLLPPHWVMKPAGMSFTTTAGKQWRAAQWLLDPDAEFVPAEDFIRAAGAAESLRTHPLVAAWLAQGKTEVSFVYTDPESGVQTKGRCDLVTVCTRLGHVVADLKMLGRGVKHHQVNRAVEDSGAWLQVTWYAHALTQLTGDHYHPAIIAASPDAPWPVRVFPLGPSFQGRALARCKELLQQLADSMRDDYWPCDERDWEPLGPELTGNKWAARDEATLFE
jgi:hypothetical protein